MGAGKHGGFGYTKGNGYKMPVNLQFFASKVYGKGGHISEKSFSEHAEYFLGKSAKRIAKDMQQQGYETHIERSRHATSKAKRVVVDNTSQTKNVSVVQISPGSKRHGETPYVKVSTINAGIFKIISDKSKYKSDGFEKAKLFFARRKNK